MNVQTFLFVFIFSLLFLNSTSLSAQSTVEGKIFSDGVAVQSAKVFLRGTQLGSITDEGGNFCIENIPEGSYTLSTYVFGYEEEERKVKVTNNSVVTVNFELTANVANIEEVVVSGTMKEVSKLNCAVPVEVYSARFFKSNPTPTVFDALQNINGVRPQLNCNVCSTGDIHINGLEGPYTMILIDGMPIVSGLATVYGLSGIPQSLIDRVEIVKGPASALYGSEAVGGLINVITKNPENAPIVSADIFGTTWGEVNADVATKFNVGNKVKSLIGINYYNYQLPTDNNNDGFTDVTLQNRVSVFNKWNFKRKENRLFSLAGRYVYEDRWGGEMNWSKNFRGGDSIYGESIYTSRWEIFGAYQLPIKEKVVLQFSGNGHDQNSVYGTTLYNAKQYVGFGQLTWSKELNRNDLLVGATFRYIYYDDNTTATSEFDTINAGANMPSVTYLPGVFIQDEVSLNENNKLLLGVRYDYNSIHGNIFTPRLNYKWNSRNNKSILRVGVGNGYRVANVFAEDHAALTGSRQVEFIEDLNPETSWNGNVNFVKRMFLKNGLFIGADASMFYTYFNNKIIADYDTDPNKIIYDNLDGYAVSQGISLNIDIAYKNLKILLGGTYMDVYSLENGHKVDQLFTEDFTGVWSIGYTFKRIDLTIDYTGNVYSPMRLPLLSSEDPRDEYSPWWSIQNIQITKKFKNGFELYGGVKNLLNWTPNKGNPFIISRSNDPFDKNVQFGAQGEALVTTDNPYGLTFDPTYVYGPNQGIRGFLGVRYAFGN